MLGVTKYRLKALLAMQVVLFSLNAQCIITTIAGTNTAGYNGDGGNSTGSELNDPYGLTFDLGGNLYIVDVNNNRIRKINSIGIMTTLIGNGTQGYSGDGGYASAAEINHPGGLAFDALGNFYISDTRNNCIRMVNTNGTISTFAGNGTAGFSGDGGYASVAELNNPSGLTFDLSGSLYIADYNNNRIRKIDTEGIINTIAGNGISGYSGDGGAASMAELNFPSELAFDEANNLYIADTWNNRIRMINTLGSIRTIVGNGTQGYSGDGGGANLAELNLPCGIVFDWIGNLYIADYNNNRIRKVNTSGIISTVVGNGAQGYSGDGGSAINAELYNPYGITLDTIGNLYFSDSQNNRIRKVTNVGQTANIKQIKNKSVQVMVYPNPTKDILNIDGLMLNENAEVRVTNMLGEEVISRNIEGKSNLQIDVSNLQNGVYFVQVTTSTSFCTQKFIVQH
jgi:sugar lactone lactonase YvrE